MKCTFLFLFLQLFAVSLFCQDSTWKKTIIDENLAVSLPGKPVITDTTTEKKNLSVALRILKTNSAFSAIIVTTTSTDLGTIDNPESAADVYKGVAEGIKNSAAKSNLEYNSKDTTINNIPCKIASLSAKDALNEPKLRALYFLLNGKIYYLAAIAQAGNSEETANDMKKLIASVHFTNKVVKEQEFASKSDSMAYRLGHIFGYVAVPVLIIIIIIVLVFVLKRSRRNKAN